MKPHINAGTTPYARAEMIARRNAGSPGRKTTAALPSGSAGAAGGPSAAVMDPLQDRLSHRLSSI